MFISPIGGYEQLEISGFSENGQLPGRKYWSGGIMVKQRKYVVFAVLAAAFYALNTPVSKMLLEGIPPTLLAGILYIGAGAGMAVPGVFRMATKKVKKEDSLDRGDLPYTLAMIMLDIAAPVLLLAGLCSTSAASVSLLNNFEIAVTSLIAFLFFKEKIGKRTWVGIAFITAACMLLTLEEGKSLQFSFGSIYVLLACCCWGLENNCTKKISKKDPVQIVMVKGLCSGTGSLVVGFLSGERIADTALVPAALLLGFVAYGLSISCYVYAQRGLGAARTSAYYALAPFFGVLLSVTAFGERPGMALAETLAAMIAGTYLVSSVGKRRASAMHRNGKISVSRCKTR